MLQARFEWWAKFPARWEQFWNFIPNRKVNWILIPIGKSVRIFRINRYPYWTFSEIMGFWISHPLKLRDFLPLLLFNSFIFYPHWLKILTRSLRQGCYTRSFPLFFLKIVTIPIYSSIANEECQDVSPLCKHIANSCDVNIIFAVSCQKTCRRCDASGSNNRHGTNLSGAVRIITSTRTGIPSVNEPLELVKISLKLGQNSQQSLWVNKRSSISFE